MVWRISNEWIRNCDQNTINQKEGVKQAQSEDSMRLSAFHRNKCQTQVKKQTMK